MMFMLFVGMGWAQGNLTVDQIKKDGAKAYTIKSKKGAYLGMEENLFYVSRFYNQNDNNVKQDPRFLWAFYEVTSGKTTTLYMYNLASGDVVRKQDKFASHNLSIAISKVTLLPSETVQNNGIVDAQYPIVVALDNSQLNMHNDGVGAKDHGLSIGWNDKSDSGNKCIFTEVDLPADLVVADKVKGAINYKINEGTVVASLENLSNDKVYHLKNVDPNGTRGNLTSSFNNATWLAATTRGNGYLYKNPDTEFVLLKSTKGNFYMYNPSQNKFVGCPNTGNESVPVLDPLPKFPVTIEFAGNSVFRFKSNGVYFGISTGLHGGSIVYHKQADGGNQFNIIEVANPLSDKAKIAKALANINQYESGVTFHYTDEANNKFDLSKKCLTGAAAAQAALDFYEVVSCEPANIETSTKDVNVTVRRNFPFEFTVVENGQFPENATHWYNLSVKEQNQYFVYADDDNINNVKNGKGLDKSHLWAFAKVPGDAYSIKVYNWAAGANKTLGATANNGQAKFMNSGADFKDQLLLKKNGNAFVLQYPGVTDSHLGAHHVWDNGKNQNLKMGFWKVAQSGTGDGSSFIVHSVEAELSAIYWKGNDKTHQGSLVGTYASDFSENVTKLGLAYVEAKTNAHLSNLMTALQNEEVSFDRTMISANKFYQFVSYNDALMKGKAMYAIPYCGTSGGSDKYGDRWLLMENENVDVVKTAMKFIPVDGGKYKIQHVNSKYWFAKPSAFGDQNPMDLPIGDNGNLLILNNERGFSNVWSLRGDNDNGKFFHCGVQNGNNSYKVLSRHQTPAHNDGNLWIIREITEVPVAVGEAKWATLCLPMPVKTPEVTDQHIYVVSAVEANGAMTLAEIPAGSVIAKETPVLLYAPNGATTFNFAVQDANVTGVYEVAANQLSGATARRWGFNEGNGKAPIPYYALGNKGKVAFYPSTSNTVPANKAYMLKSKVPTGINPTSLYFSFGDVTGIENAPVEESKDVKYYDLSGKRVLYPSNGVFITSEGKKVFIK